MLTVVATLQLRCDNVLITSESDVVTTSETDVGTTLIFDRVTKLWQRCHNVAMPAGFSGNSDGCSGHWTFCFSDCLMMFVAMLQKILVLWSVWERLNFWVTTTRLSITWLSKYVIRCLAFFVVFSKSIPSRWSESIFFGYCFRVRFWATKWDILWLSNTSYVISRKFKNRRNNILPQSLDISIQKRLCFQFE